MSFYLWSKTASLNATSDPSVNWSEGQLPSTVNDSARAGNAALAKYRDDNGPNLNTGGTSTAYTLTTNQVFDTAAHMATASLSFFVHATNGASPTITIDGLGPYPIVVDGSSTPVPTGAMVAGSVHSGTFSNSTSQFRLKGFYNDPFNVPVGGALLYFGATVPNSNFAFADGSAISRTTYATCFSVMGTTYGTGNGSTTFNLPDMGGRVPAGKEASATRLTATYFVSDSTALGATGGLESHTLTTAQLAVTTPTGTISQITPAGTISQITPAGTITDGAISISGGTTGAVAGTTAVAAAGHAFADVGSAIAASQSGSTFAGTPVTPTFSGTPVTPTFSGASFGSGSPHKNVQPTIICNYIIRII